MSLDAVVERPSQLRTSLARLVNHYSPKANQDHLMPDFQTNLARSSHTHRIAEYDYSLCVTMKQYNESLACPLPSQRLNSIQFTLLNFTCVLKFGSKILFSCWENSSLTVCTMLQNKYISVPSLVT